MLLGKSGLGLREDSADQVGGDRLTVGQSWSIDFFVLVLRTPTGS